MYSNRLEEAKKKLERVDTKREASLAQTIEKLEKQLQQANDRAKRMEHSVHDTI